MTVNLLTEQHLEFQILTQACTRSSESTLVKMPHCWKSHVTAHIKISASFHFVVSLYPTYALGGFCVLLSFVLMHFFVFHLPICILLFISVLSKYCFFFVKVYVRYCTVVNVHENLISDNIPEFLALQIQTHKY